MLIAAALGGALLVVALGALRFARMNVAAETEAFARRKEKVVAFEGTLTARAAREAVPAALAPFTGDRVRITVQRLPDGPDGGTG